MPKGLVTSIYQLQEEGSVNPTLKYQKIISHFCIWPIPYYSGRVVVNQKQSYENLILGNHLGRQRQYTRLTIFPVFTTIVICLLIWWRSLVAYFTNTMDSNQSASLIWSEFIVFASMIKAVSSAYICSRHNKQTFLFGVPVNSYGNVETVSSPNHTFPGRARAKGLTSTQCTYFGL